MTKKRGNPNWKKKDKTPVITGSTITITPPDQKITEQLVYSYLNGQLTKEIQQRTIVDDIRLFVASMRGKHSMGPIQVKEMDRLFNAHYGTNISSQGCQECVIMTFKRLSTL